MRAAASGILLAAQDERSAVCGIEEKLAQQWSPEQIAGRLRLDGIVSVSPNWIYRHVRSDRAGGGTL